jgi:hypothetical protein
MVFKSGESGWLVDRVKRVEERFGEGGGV